MSEKDDVVFNLEVAARAMRVAAKSLFKRYGKGYQNAIELNGAAGMIDGWIKEIGKEKQ